MADVVRNGAIFRVKNATPMRSPMPRLPVARGRISSATPETPAGKRGSLGSGGGSGRVRSALERVVPRAPVALPPPLQGQTKRGQSAAVDKKGVVQRPAQSPEDASVVASFNRLVSESETRRAAKRPGSGSGSGKKMARVKATKEEEEEAEEEEEESGVDATDTTPRPRAKGRKRPRTQPDEEPSDQDEDEDEDDAEEQFRTPQPRRLPDASSDRDEQSGEDDGDDVQVQKRLMYDDTPPAKPKPARKSADPPATKAKAASKASVPRSRGRTPKKVAVAGGSGLELLSMSSAATPSRSTRIRTGVMVMSEWYVDWPPAFVGDQLQLIVHGQVLGQPTSFTVQRRVTDEQFVSTDNQNVRLNGCLDIDHAQRADVPPVVMELLVEGIPTNWRQLLEAYAPPPDPWMPLSVKSKEKAKQKNAKAAAAAAAEAERMAIVSTPDVKKSAKKPPKSAKATPAKATGGSVMTLTAEKRSRSGRHLTPVMEWWRNERKVVDANFEAKIVEGSPSFLPSNRTKMSEAAKAARQKIQEIYDAQRKSAEWSDAQLTALHDAKVQVPTTHINFWAEVAKLVPGKSADECRARSFDDLPVQPPRKNTGAGAGGTGATVKQSAQSQVPVKIHRAGSNLFKKQVRQFVHDQEQKNVDDLFSQDTPSKDVIGDASGFDDLKSPGALTVESTNRDGDDSDDDALLAGAGRELLQKVSLSKRDDVDSYVRTLKRGNDGLGLKAVRTSKAPTSSDFTTPPAKKKPRREGVKMVSEVGTHVIEAIVTPNGTTRVRVEMGSDEEEMLNQDEEDEEAALSDAF